MGFFLGAKCPRESVTLGGMSMIKGHLEEVLRELREERARAMSVHGAQMEPFVGHVCISPVEQWYATHERLSRKIERIERALGAIDGLPPDLLYVLDRRWGAGWSWGRIARSLGCSRATVWRLKRGVVRALGAASAGGCSRDAPRSPEAPACTPPPMSGG